jgi:hypothetical protein
MLFCVNIPPAPRKPMRFFVKGAAALVALFLVTLLMRPAPEVRALRAFIGVGLVTVIFKMVLRYNNIDWPRRRY